MLFRQALKLAFMASQAGRLLKMTKAGANHVAMAMGTVKAIPMSPEKRKPTMALPSTRLGRSASPPKVPRPIAPPTTRKMTNPTNK